VRIVYLAPADIQIARVERQLMISFCAALSKLGIDVELVALQIKLMPGELRGKSPLSLYRVRKPFRLRLVRVPVSQESADRWLALNRLLAHTGVALRAAITARRGEPVAFFARNYSSLGMLLAIRCLAPTRLLVVAETHVPPRGALQKFVLRRVDRVIANTHALKRDLLGAGNVAEGNVIGAHQGVDLEAIDELRLSKHDARAYLGLPIDKRLVVYTGKIYLGYGEVEHLLEAARNLEDRDVQFVLVGGRADHVSEFKERVVREGRRNVIFTGFVAPNSVQNYQFAADVLVLYYNSGMELNRYRSPGKLFEYMAATRPIVAVDLPVLREVLGDPPAAVLVPPDSPMLLAREIARLLDNPTVARRLAETAHRRVAGFTWGERAARILAFLR
jgi:glycosyltransferase involved in cell wall biosynthesis